MGHAIWEIPIVKTLTVDSAKRVRIPDARPRQVFAYEHDDDGRVTLTPVEPICGKAATLIRRNGRTYLVSKRTLSNEDVQRVMENFP